MPTVSRVVFVPVTTHSKPALCILGNGSSSESTNGPGTPRILDPPWNYRMPIVKSVMPTPGAEGAARAPEKTTPVGSINCTVVSNCVRGISGMRMATLAS